MRSVSLSTWILTATLLAPSYALAQGVSDDHLEAARELLEVTNAEAIIEQSMQAIRQMIPFDSTQAERATEFTDMMEAIFVEEFSWDELGPELARLYAEVFTEGELCELTAFYRTELGQKMLVRLPEIMQRSTALAQRRLQEVLPRVLERIRANRRPRG